MFQDALTDLTGDSERLPVEEQHGTWLGHKVGDYCFKVLMTYNTHILLNCTASSEIFPPPQRTVSTSNITPDSKGHFGC